MFEGLSAGTPIGKAGILLGTVLTAFYSPITALLVACFAFTVTDMVYGIKVAKKFHQKITSDKNWKGTITKILDEFTIISLARLLEFAVLGETGVFVLTGGATVIISLTELWSILENLNTLNPDGPWKALGKFLKKKGEEYIGTEIDLNDEHTSDNKLDNSES
jgi:phage-related holin